MKPTIYRDTTTGYVVTVGIVLSRVTVELLPLAATVCESGKRYDVTTEQFLSDRFEDVEV